jgi:hypothetical protein
MVLPPIESPDRKIDAMEAFIKPSASESDSQDDAAGKRGSKTIPNRSVFLRPHPVQRQGLCQALG